jgi:hypothetical protein
MGKKNSSGKLEKTGAAKDELKCHRQKLFERSGINPSGVT